MWLGPRIKMLLIDRSPDANILVVGFNIVLLTSKHAVTNIMSVHNSSADERLLLSPTLVPRIDLCAFALSLSSRPFLGEAAKEFVTNDSGNRDSEQPRRYEHRYKNKCKTKSTTTESEGKKH